MFAIASSNRKYLFRADDKSRWSNLESKSYKWKHSSGSVESSRESFNFSLQSRKICEMFFLAFSYCLSPFRQEEAFDSISKSEKSSSCKKKGRNYWSVTYSFNCFSRFQADATALQWMSVNWRLNSHWTRVPPFKKRFSKCFLPKLDIHNSIVTRTFLQKELPNQSIPSAVNISFHSKLMQFDVLFIPL